MLDTGSQKNLRPEDESAYLAQGGLDLVLGIGHTSRRPLWSHRTIAEKNTIDPCFAARKIARAVDCASTTLHAGRTWMTTRQTFYKPSGQYADDPLEKTPVVGPLIAAQQRWRARTVNPVHTGRAA
jgi:hypothetical protein